MKGWKYNLLKFTAEFILIVTGIILSFYIQGKIEDRSAKKEARQIMQQIFTDLVSDTLRFNHEISSAKKAMAHSLYLLDLNTETQLNTEADLDSFLTCFWYTTTNLKTHIHTTGYTRLLNFSNKNIINDDTLINNLIGYYTVDKGIIDGFMKLDADFVDGKLTDVYTEPFAYEILNIDHGGKPYPANFKDEIITFLGNKKIRSLILFNVSNKAYFIQNIESTKNAASNHLNELQRWLRKF